MDTDQVETLKRNCSAAFRDVMFTNPIVHQAMRLLDEGFSEDECMRLAIVNLARCPADQPAHRQGEPVSS